MKKHDIFKCKPDKFWRRNVLKAGIKNWIKQKYQYDTIVRFIDNNISIQFIGVDYENYMKIIDEICQQYNMEVDSVFKGCKKQNEVISKVYIYELRSKHVRG